MAVGLSLLVPSHLVVASPGGPSWGTDRPMFDTSRWNGGAQVTQTVQRGIAAANNARSQVSNFAGNAAQQALTNSNLPTNLNNRIANTAQQVVGNGMANIGASIGNSVAGRAGAVVGSMAGSNMGAQIMGGMGNNLRMPSNISGFAANAAQQAFGSPMPLNGFRSSLSNTVMRVAANVGGTAGGMIGQAIGGNLGGGIGAAVGAGAALNAGAQLLGGNGLNMQMPWNSSNPIPGMIIGSWLGNVLSNNGFSIPPIQIPSLSQGANGAINGAINGAVGGAVGGAIGSMIGGGNVGGGAISGAVGGIIGGALGGSSMGGMGGMGGMM